MLEHKQETAPAGRDTPVRPDGKALRVLHIGNIANNAYYNAKFLRRHGVEADVLCPGDYWIMSSPEWEEADIDEVPGDQYHPDWWSIDLKGYQRPRWFAQGPFDLCVDYLLARRQGTKDANDRCWHRLDLARQAICGQPHRFLFGRIGGLARRLRNGVRRLLTKAAEELTPPRSASSSETAGSFHQEYQARCRELIAEFERRFPRRCDKLTMSDLLAYESDVKRLRQLFRMYDLVQCYATCTLYPMLAGFHPYVAFEHGTLRDSPDCNWPFKGPFCDNPIGRLTALSYALADHVFITNADCLSSAQRLGLTSFEPMAHPLDENDFAPTDEHRRSIRSELGVEIVLFCPIRHDWIDKGVDKYIRALPALREALGRPFMLCLTPWGKEIERSRKLIASLGCEDLVQWVGPFGRVQFSRWLSACDVVLDQVAYPSFSGVTPRALSCGVPVVASCEADAMAWMFPEPAPVLHARSVEDIIKQVVTAVDPAFQAENRTPAREWILRNHSSRKVVKQLLNAYGKLLNRPDLYQALAAPLEV